MIRFGPAGIGGEKEAVSNLKKFAEKGINACEIPFTYQIYIKDKKVMKEIKETAKKLDVKISIHAPYWINLNSKEKKKIEESKKRILDCCKVGNEIGAYIVVFHSGFYGKMSKEETYQNIKHAIIDIMKVIKKNKWKVKLAPETMGKVNVFGDIDEILRLVKETGCFFCMDFAHFLARNRGKSKYSEAYEKISKFHELHCHFSGIEWTKAGERKHKITSETEIRKLLKIFPEDKEIVIINESPDPLGDSIKSINIYREMK